MKVCFTSLGCAKNLIDSEQMLSLVVEAGHEIVSDPTEAEGAVVNTCAFIEAAQQEAIDAILELAELKKTGSLRRLVVTGCLPQRYQGDILKEIPEIDAVLGTGSFPDVVAALESEEEHYARFRDKSAPLPELDRLVSTGPAWAYIKIADGCDKRCAYCVIPSIRGKYRSRPMAAILQEARALAEGGIKELILVAQDVTWYGHDLRDGTNLTALLKALAKIPGIAWIRLHYLYPSEITDELIEEIAAEPKIVKYLDIPVQHVNDDILRRMRRPERKETITALFDKLRARIEGVVLRTTFIVGLPGEGPEEFQEVMDFMRDPRLPRAGVFALSPQEGTAAAEMTDRCTEEEAEARRRMVMELQCQIMDDYDRQQIGREFQVLCQGREDG
ncbi:MAG: 30S ribosomal protein S12 methylthiotransferase RimO, partial [Oscillospiraceae bacterium]|nr:30S ribosomal protein S12 methylthiotransferase RimO [Oscillospiraceae bacterium]